MAWATSSRSSLIQCWLPAARLHSTFADYSSSAALYVHWPYCNKRCTYCNFNKYVSSSIDHERMKLCLVKETATLLKLSGVRHITSVFFGGGTPSIARAQTIEAVLNTVSSKCILVKDAEVTIEVNPSSAAGPKMRDYHSAGVNRFSIGLQTLNDDDLIKLNRDHTVTDSLRCLEVCETLTPGRVSVDLLFGRPGQTLEACHTELMAVLNACSRRRHHLSLYQLTVERGTQLHKDVESGVVTLPDADVLADMYEMAVQILEDAGVMRYEASNFAVPGHESTHNQSYWRGRQYIGVGPGAHGRFVVPGASDANTNDVHIERQARVQTLEPVPWMSEVECFGHGTRKIIKQTPLDMLKELLLVGIRTAAGVDAGTWQALTGSQKIQDFVQPGVLLPLVSAGLIQPPDDSGGIRCTARGLNVADSIASQLIKGLLPFGR